jgi:hypothetical protein
MHIILDPELDRMIEEARCLPILRRAVLVVSILETLGERPDSDTRRIRDESVDIREHPSEESEPERATSWSPERLLGEGGRC